MLTLIKRPRTSLRNGKKPRQWKFGHLKLVLHCNTCCANTTKYALASSTLKTRNGLAKSEPRPVAKACGGLQELRHRHHQRRFAGLIHAAEPASEKCWFDCFSSMPSYSQFASAGGSADKSRKYERSQGASARRPSNLKWDKKFRIRVARNRRLACSR